MPEHKITCPHCSKDFALSEQEANDIMVKGMKQRMEKSLDNFKVELKQKREEEQMKIKELELYDVDEILDLQLEDIEEAIKKHPEKADEIRSALWHLRDSLK